MLQTASLKFTINCITSCHIIQMVTMLVAAQRTIVYIEPDNVILIEYKSVEQFYYLLAASLASLST